MQGVRAKKSLGQHFLIDKNIAMKIAESLKAENCKSIIEIGPGTGMLTKHLQNRVNNFFAVELDNESVDFLIKEFEGGKEFVIHDDFLRIDLNRFEAPLAIIGNFPYYISSQILFKVLDYADQVDEVVCMIQKEVALRIASPPGNKTYGILSVLLQCYYDIEYLFTVHEQCFSPPPKVKSAVIRLKRNSRMELPCESRTFKMVIKQAFNQRRKTLRNSLKNICLNLDSSPEIFNKRPEQLSVEDFIGLASHIEGCM